MPALNHRISIYVPSTTDGNKPARRAQRKETTRAAKYLCKYFGGCTATAARGYYQSSGKGLISERQNIVYAATTAADLKRHESKIKAYARRLARRMTQEAVTVEIDSKLIFIEG